MVYRGLRLGMGPHVAGAALIFVLILILLLVLHSAVRRGVTAKAEFAERAQAQWKCNASQGRRQRDNCLAQSKLTSLKERNP